MYKRQAVYIALIFLGLSLSPLVRSETVWIDVRTAVEHKLDNIDGDTRIPHGKILTEITKLYPKKDTEIHLYCRSGGRAGKAIAALQEAGYTRVFNAGGIDDAREARGLKK